MCVLFFVMTYHQFALSQSDDIKSLVLSESVRLRHSMPLQYHIRLSILTTKSSPSRIQMRNVSIWRLRDKYRCDVSIVSDSQDPESDGSRDITCRNCDRSGYAIQTRCGNSSYRAVANFIPIDADFDKKDAWHIDWRGLGLLGEEIESYSSMPMSARHDFFVKSKNVSVTDLNLEGSDCKLISHKRVEDRQNRYYQSETYYCKEFNLNPIKHSVSSDQYGMSAATEIKYQLLHGKYWYPLSLRTERKSGGQQTSEQIITIVHADFITPVNDRIFSLESMSLDNNQPIAFPEYKSIKDFPVWRNGKLDKKFTVEMLSREVDDLLGKSKAPTADQVPFMVRNVWLYYLAAAILILISILLIRQARKAQR
jgi:hypothetical protein